MDGCLSKSEYALTVADCLPAALLQPACRAPCYIEMTWRIMEERGSDVDAIPAPDLLDVDDYAKFHTPGFVSLDHAGESNRAQRYADWSSRVPHALWKRGMSFASVRDLLLRSARDGAELGPSRSRSPLYVRLSPTGKEPTPTVIVDEGARGGMRARLLLPDDPLYPPSCKAERFERSAPGMWGVCDTLDAELIEAFLSAGRAAEADVSAAVDACRDDLLPLYRLYGAPLEPRRVIDGTRYVHGHRGRVMDIVVPEGIEEIGPLAFGEGRIVLGAWGDRIPRHLSRAGSEDDPVIIGGPIRRCSRISLPQTLRAIGPCAFRGVAVDEVVIPSSVEFLGVGAFSGARRIVVYDTISPDAYPAESCLDTSRGTPNSAVGWLGVDPRDLTAPNIADARCSDFEVVVRSARTGETLYRVFMPLGGGVRRRGWPGKIEHEVAATLVSSWGRGASFAFARLDVLFDRLPDQRARIKTAIDRLLYPLDLLSGARGCYRDYIARNARRAVALMAEDDDVAALRTLEDLVVRPRSRPRLIELCEGAPRMREHLEGLA